MDEQIKTAMGKIATKIERLAEQDEKNEATILALSQAVSVLAGAIESLNFRRQV